MQNKQLQNGIIKTYEMKKTSIELITQERREMIEKHGRSIESDVRRNANFQLSEGAGILTIVDMKKLKAAPLQTLPEGWNLLQWERMLRKPYPERLIIAAALIAAEIDRLMELEI